MKVLCYSLYKNIVPDFEPRAFVCLYFRDKFPLLLILHPCIHGKIYKYRCDNLKTDMFHAGGNFKGTNYKFLHFKQDVHCLCIMN